MITVSKRANPNRGSHLREISDPFVVNWRISARPHIWRPPTDLIELDDRYIVRVEIAGVDEANFLVTLDQNLLSIKGVRADLSETRAYHQMEINFGDFFSAVEIPGPIDSQAVTAEYQQGLLWIHLPKAPPLRIHISE
jgi:HSP20 family protein